MGRPVFLSENLLSTMQWPAHVVTANAEAAGREAWRVATGRRAARDYWTPTATNLEGWVRVDCGAARTADTVALDRGHNLGGFLVQVQTSPDGAVWTTAAACTVPSVSAAATSIDATNGARTPEGAWIKRFTPVSARYWRLRVPAMGAGLRPVVVGLWIAECWRPTQYLALPFTDSSAELRYQASTSDRGWQGLGTVARPRTGSFRLQLGTHAELTLGERHLSQFWYPRPIWIVFDEAKAERSVLALCLPGRVGFELQEGWSYPQTMVGWVEHEPRPPA